MFSFTHLFHKDHNRDPNNVEASDERGLVDQGSTLDRCASVGVPVHSGFRLRGFLEFCETDASVWQRQGYSEYRSPNHTHTHTCMLHS